MDLLPQYTRWGRWIYFGGGGGKLSFYGPKKLSCSMHPPPPGSS